MKAIKFKEANTIFGKDQPEYKPLPAFVDENRIVVTCYKMSLQERLKVIFTGKVWLSIMAFNGELQPQKMEVNKSEVFQKAK